MPPGKWNNQLLVSVDHNIIANNSYHGLNIFTNRCNFYTSSIASYDDYWDYMKNRADAIITNLFDADDIEGFFDGSTGKKIR